MFSSFLYMFEFIGWPLPSHFFFLFHFTRLERRTLRSEVCWCACKEIQTICMDSKRTKACICWWRSWRSKKLLASGRLFVFEFDPTLIVTHQTSIFMTIWCLCMCSMIAKSHTHTHTRNLILYNKKFTFYIWHLFSLFSRLKCSNLKSPRMAHAHFLACFKNICIRLHHGLETEKIIQLDCCCARQ